MCNILFQYVANLTACLILVKYSFNIAKILQRHCSYIKRDRPYRLLILELYWADIPTTLMLAKYLEYTTFRYWHDVRIQSLYLGQYMRNIPYWLNIGSILHQCGCATRVDCVHCRRNGPSTVHTYMFYVVFDSIILQLNVQRLR